MLSSEALEYNFKLYQGASEYPIIKFYTEYNDNGTEEISYVDIFNGVLAAGTTNDNNSDLITDIESISDDIDDSTYEVVYKLPIDLTDYSLEMTLKTFLGKKPIDYLTTSNGRIVKVSSVDDITTNNAIELEFPASITSTYQYPEYVYDIYAIDSNNSKTILLYGKITIIKGVSHVF